MKAEVYFVFVLCAVIIAVSQAQLINNGVSCADKKVIVNYHNELRIKLANGEVPGQPEASNMQKIVWDDALEKVAQGWANKMVYKHNTNVKDPRFSVGENIFYSYNSVNNNTFDWTRAIDFWFDEHKKFTFKPTTKELATGHYTQLAWAETLYVGCGAAHYKGKPGITDKLYICNYGPAGNFLGEYPYKTGQGCENLCCKKQCKKLYGKKCSHLFDKYSDYSENSE